MIHQTAQPDLSEFPEEEDDSYLGQTIADISHRETAHELWAEKLLCIQMPEGQAFGYNTDDQHLLDFMPQLQRLYTSLMANDEPPVETVFVRWAKQSRLKLTKLGKQVLEACKYIAAQDDEGRDWQQAYSHHRFHPVTEVMLRAVMRWWDPICRCPESTGFVMEIESDAQAVEGLRHLVEFVRRVCRSQAFQNRLHDHERKAEDNFRSGGEHIIEQFERHAQLLVHRIDLYFRPEAKEWGYGKTADKAVINYLRALRLGRIVPGYLGFLIKRENGISRGMHYHLMVILDGHRHRSAYYLTQVMGAAWLKRVGTDKGSYFNCYAKKDRYRYNGLGLVRVGDTEKLIGLRIAVWYMSKQDCELKVDDAKVKNFWRSWKVRGDSNRGAPRKDPDSMCLVKRILGGVRSTYPPGFEPPTNSSKTAAQSRAVAI